MRNGLCLGCQLGKHAEHDPWPTKPPKGMLGGVRCPCGGECVERGPIPEIRDVLDTVHAAYESFDRKTGDNDAD